MKTFGEFGLPPALVQALDAMEFKAPTPIQALAIPPAMEGKDILAIAPTGTGKTGAFGIPALAFLYPQPGKQVLVLAPTRELAAQIHKFLRKMCDALDLQSVLIVGGEPFGRQKSQVKRGVDLIIATPGRLWDHIEQGMPIQNIGVMVLDEVDRMLDMGFAPQVEQIASKLSAERQTYLFSATLPPEIVRLVNKYLKDPVKVNVTGNPAEAPKIKEERIDTTDAEKPQLLVEQVEARTGKILVFANTQGRVEQVARRLEGAGHPAACMHGGRTHRERKGALDAFRSGEVRVLVATDIAARGIDVADVEHVINYDYPATKEDYLHRIGRTGRIGKEGSAITFVDPKRKRMSERRPFSPRVEGAFGRQMKREQGRPGPRPPFRPNARPDFQPGFKPDFQRGDRPAFGGGRPDFKPGFRPGGDRPAFRPGGDRPGFQPRGERPAFRPTGDRPAFKPEFQKPVVQAEGEKPTPKAAPEKPVVQAGGPEFKTHKPSGERPAFKPGFKPDFKPRGDRPDFKPRGDRPDFKSRGDRPGFRPRGDRPDFKSRGERPFKPGFKPGFKRGGDFQERGPREFGGGERREFKRAPRGESFDDAGPRPMRTHGAPSGPFQGPRKSFGKGVGRPFAKAVHRHPLGAEFSTFAGDGERPRAQAKSGPRRLFTPPAERKEFKRAPASGVRSDKGTLRRKGGAPKSAE